MHINCMYMCIEIKTSLYLYKHVYTRLNHVYPGEKVTEIYMKVTERDQKVTELPNSLWIVLWPLRSEVPYIGTEPILP